jgi:tetratricopeptide (TPR) repeat protein
VKLRHAGYLLSTLALCAIAALAWFLVGRKSRPPLPDKKPEPRSIKESLPAAAVGSTESDLDEEDFAPEIIFPHLPSPEEAGQAHTEFWREFRKASDAGRYLDALALCDEYLKKYPPINMVGVRIVSLRIGMLERSGQVDEARRALEQALATYENTVYAPWVGLWMADFDRRHGDFLAAENRLIALMAIPIPETIRNSSDVGLQLGGLPAELAEVYKDQLRFDDAEVMLRQARDRAVQVALRNPGVPGLPSCAFSMYTEMALLNFDRDKGVNFEENTRKAREFVEEYVLLFPNRDPETQRHDLGTERMLHAIIALRKRARDKATGQANGEKNEESLPYITSR